MSKRNRNSLLATVTPSAASHHPLGATSSPGAPSNAQDHPQVSQEAPHRPANPAVYPFNDGAPHPTYPDYNPWKDDYAHDHHMNLYLSKGYFEAPVVSNEYCSARHMIQHTLFINVDNCNHVLEELSQHLANAYKTRNQVINKIKHDSNHFSLPPRVTLTSAKREAWLRDLANPEVSFAKLGEKLPHGIRNKVLIDAVCSRHVPLNRALWYTKCTLYGEYLVLEKRRKVKSSPSKSTPSSLGGQAHPLDCHWLQEWTQQVADYIVKFSREMVHIATPERKAQYLAKFSYMVRYVSLLYIENLLDKTYFLTLILKSFREGIATTNSGSGSDDDDDDDDHQVDHTPDSHYGQRLVALELITVFWHDLLKSDYMLKELCSGLLLNHHHLSKHVGPTSAMLPVVTDKVVYLFHRNTNLFILPTHWSVVQKSLWQILEGSVRTASDDDKHELRRQLELIRYRNESLMLNYRATSRAPGDLLSQRASDDLIRVVHSLDHRRLTSSLAKLFDGPQWRVYLRAALWWSVTSRVNSSAEGALIVCSFLKKSVVSPGLRLEMENEIVDATYAMAESIGADDHQRLHNLYVLINELYQLKLLTISAYLRKLIASGLFYGDGINPEAIQVHINVLHHLPTINNKQCNNLLRKARQPNDDFTTKFDQGKQILDREIIDRVLNDSFPTTCDNTTGDISQITQMEVGLRFLLINWLTHEFKQRVQSASTLVHITPTTVAHLYLFYRQCDNLSVFFKEVVRFILRNDAGVIICYMDSLYLFARILMQHMPLVKHVTSSAVDSVSVGYPLFDLMVRLYLDLSPRDFDWFNFAAVWQFMEQKIDRRSLASASVSPKSPSVSVGAQSPMPLKTPNLPFEGVDSPMRLNDDVSAAMVVSQRFSLPEFVSLLTRAQAAPEVDIDPEEASALQQSSQIHSLAEAIEALKHREGEAAATVVKLVRHFGRHGQYLEVLEELVVDLPVLPLAESKRAVSTIACYELIPWPKLVEAISGSDDLVSWLLIEDDPSRTTAQTVQFQAVRHWFRYRVPHRFSDVMLARLQRGLVNQAWLVESIASRDVSVINYVMSLEHDQALRLLNEQVGVFPHEISDSASIIALADVVDEFNLPFFQLALRAVVTKDPCSLPVIVDQLLLRFRYRFAEVNRFFGDVFDLLPDTTKTEVVLQLERLFLAKTQFTDTTVSLVLNSENDAATAVDVLPILADAFQKFTSGGGTIADDVGSFSSTHGPSGAIDQFTRHLVTVANASDAAGSSALEDAISIYLRILIIYRSAIATALAGDADGTTQFVHNLVSLLHSSFLATAHEKLRIVLYDLLLLLRTQGECAGSAGGAEGAGAVDGVAVRAPALWALDDPTEAGRVPSPSAPPPMASSVTSLDEDELNGGDYNYFNHHGLVMEPSARDPGSLANLLGTTTPRRPPPRRPFAVKGFEVFEDTSAGVNDACVNLSVFDAYTTKENPS
ncbi:hypothetical protein DIURU_000240 [Diutina rugosa]|uniref:Mediator of RNA polymerase II transcription subunit 12 n=1 Tax=Diutina rugosa TaxID=5481 RepID=A0A642UZ63_DIURU|nr:uncharacterized protein DIURU_000240 [Diutina rugosa]KAA8908271.1 hypothetical protein DIURU_000240 [Diutina rugosa]